jgi:hypothetical protein
MIIIILTKTVIQLKWEKKTDGILRVDTSGPNADIYRLDLGQTLEKLSGKKTITLKVVHCVISPPQS